MFATQCQFCRHDNAPGARFCADCGSPLHLKPCPKCGKVDDADASACYACGAEFPPIATAGLGATPLQAAEPAVTAPAMPRPSAGSAATHADPGRARTRAPAWPLVLVALLAGGLPLVWMNRAHLPLPQAWRPGGSASLGETGPSGSATLPLRTPPPAGSATPPLDAPPPVRPAPQPNVTPAPLTGVSPQAETPAPAAAPEAAPPPARQPETPKATAAPPRTKASVPLQATRQVPRPKPAASAAPAPQPKAAAEAPAPTSAPAVQECTEAISALGLCDPRKSVK